MSASEKLGVLHRAMDDNHDMKALIAVGRAMTEIVAVVEAAEVAEEVHGCPQLTKSLAALNVKLTADGNDKEEGN